MSAKRLSMRKTKEILRLKFKCGLSYRQIAKSCSIGRTTVADYIRRAEDAGLSWSEIGQLDETQLERLLFSPPVIGEGHRPLPDCPLIHEELRKKGVTLFLLWQEYKEAYPHGYQYSWFCRYYRQWRNQLDLVMRQSHRAGEKLFVDYAGQTVEVIDPQSGEVREAQIFVAVLGASNYTYAEATWSQSLPDWIGVHVRAFEFYGGVTEILVPDNLKSGVTKPCFYDPDLNPSYQEMAKHFGCAVIPARIRKARDKAKVESGVQVVERWILARLRKKTFFSLSELNAEIRRLLEHLNDKPFQKLPGCRRSAFEELDRPALKPLPTEPYEYAEWKKVRVNIDYHVEVDRHYYSVPYQLVRCQLDARFTRSTVEILHKGRRVASHVRSYKQGGYTTLAEHMPTAHRQWAEWTPERLVRWAAKTGAATARVVEAILSSRAHPQQGFRSCLGIMRLGKKYSPERLEAACRRALAIGGTSFKSIQAILKNGLDKRPLPQGEDQPTVRHANIRGAQYYTKGGK
jgi:transposase